MPDLANLEALIARLATIDFSQTSEQATREMAVNPVIGALGWDTFSPAEVAREHPVRGGKVDYCLRGPMGALVLIEVKCTGKDLSEHQEQLLHYAFREGVPLAALTDGLVWWLYLPTAKASWEQRRFYRIDFREQDAAAAAAAMHRFLNREDSIGGASLAEAQREFESQERDRLVSLALEKAWRRVLSDPQGRLRDLLAEAVKEISGYFPDRETVTEFLQGVSGTGSPTSELLPSPPSTPAPPPRRRRAAQHASAAESPPRGARGPSVPPVAFWFGDERYPVTSWRRLWVRLCEQLAKESGPVFSERVAVLRGRSRPYFSVSGTEFRKSLPIPGAGLYVEGNLSSRAIERIARRTLHTVRGSDQDFRIEFAGQVAPTSGATPSRRNEATSVREEFRGRRPRAFWLHDNRHEATRWSEVLRGTCDQLAKETGAAFGERVVHLRGRKRLYFSEEPRRLRQPLQLTHSALYVEGNFSANNCVRLSRRVLTAIRGSDDGFRIELADPH